MEYSLERKGLARLEKLRGSFSASNELKRMLPPNNMAIRRLSQAEGISEAVLHKWRAEARGKA